MSSTNDAQLADADARPLRTYVLTEAAALLGIEEEACRRLCRSASIRACRIGNRWLIDADALDRQLRDAMDHQARKRKEAERG